MKKYALQLWSIQHMMEQNAAHALDIVRKAGFPCVEPAGLYGHTPADFQRLLEANGLCCIAAHVGYFDLQNNLDQLMRDYEQLHCRHIVCACAPFEAIASRAAWLKTAEEMNAWGRRLREYGFHYHYHNHKDEFLRHDGQLGLEILLEHTDPSWVSSELDIFWADVAGVDPMAFLNEYGQRCKLLHVKDRSKADPSISVEIGKGSLDMDAIIQKASEKAVEWFIAEQEHYAAGETDAIRHNAAMLKKLVPEISG